MNRQHNIGFTLIEIMVVIAILLVIMGVLVTSFSGVFSKSEEVETVATITTLKSNIDSFNQAWGVYPPSDLNDLSLLTDANSLREVNSTNRGIEALVLALRSGRERGPYLDMPMFGDDMRRVNLDNDRCLPDAFDASILDIPASESSDLFEIVDKWGNPFVYINIDDVRNGKVDETIMLGNGDTVQINAQACQEELGHPATGQYPKGYVLWSFGEDQKNDYGRGDDITSWDKYEE